MRTHFTNTNNYYCFTERTFLLYTNMFRKAVVLKNIPLFSSHHCLLLLPTNYSPIQENWESNYLFVIHLSKHALEAFFKSLRAEERFGRLQILIVSAGYMNTGFGTRARMFLMRNIQLLYVSSQH